MNVVLIILTMEDYFFLINDLFDANIYRPGG